MNRDYSKEEPVNTPVSFPGFTEYQRKKIFCINYNSIPSINAIFFGHWEFKPFYPFLVLFLLITSYFISFFVITQAYKAKILLNIILTLFFILSIVTYFQIIINGPGYFPFYFPQKFVDPNDPSGILSTQEQNIWRVQQKRPNRCIFSKTARRYVIRPDHYCYWVSSWIGKKNQKYFVHFTFWCSSYLLSFFIIDIGMFTDPISVSIIEMGLYFLYAIASCFFFIMCIWFFGIEINMISHNYTNWEQLNKISNERYNTGSCIGNFEDICGDRKTMWRWFLPISPFNPASNFELINGYESYDNSYLSFADSDLNTLHE